MKRTNLFTVIAETEEGRQGYCPICDRDNTGRYYIWSHNLDTGDGCILDDVDFQTEEAAEAYIHALVKK